MTNFDQKHKILASLDSLDQEQTQQVMAYIKSLTYRSAEEMSYQKFKREALKEIRQALGGTRKLRPYF
jgi:hypothetical protein